jgi:hypothetical protein
MTSKIFQQLFDAGQAALISNTGKPQARFNYAQLSDYNIPLSQQHHQQQQWSQNCQSPDPQCKPQHGMLVQKTSEGRRWTKIAAGISSTISACLSAIMGAIMIFTVWKYQKTKNLYVKGRTWGPWAKDTVTWPTYMMAAASIATSLASLVSLVALCRRSKRKAAFFSVIYAIVHIGSWIAVSVVYRVMKTDKDLWGWSCTDAAKAIQKELGSNVLNFENLCKLQVSHLLCSRN